MSTGKQAEAGLSLDAQTAKIRLKAELEDVALADVVIDAGESAKSLQRPGMAWLLAQVEAGTIETIIIAKLDRLTRSLVDLAALLQRFERRGVALVSVAENIDTGSAIGRMMLNLIVLLSQWERETIGERTRDVMRHKRAKGERVGTVPLGFQVVPGDARKRLMPAPVEQRLLARFRELAAAGCGARQIAAGLNAAGFTTRRGTAWRGEYVAHTLRKAAATA